MQPGRYVYEICRHLASAGNEVRVVSDGLPGLPQSDRVGDITVKRFVGVRFPRLKGNPALEEFISSEKPDAVLWHIGMSSLYHLRYGHRICQPVVGLFTSPVYSLKELGSTALTGPFQKPSTYCPIVLGALAPRWLVAGFMRHNNVRSLIVMNEKTRNALAQRGVDRNLIHVVPNGLDKEWLRPSDAESIRQEFAGVRKDDFIALYLGSPEAYRGADTVIEALATARRECPTLKLIILSRRRSDRPSREESCLHRQIGRLGLEDAVSVVGGFQSPERVRQVMSAADVIVLPFKIVTSGVPLSILEAMALGKPVIATDVDAIPEVLAGGRGCIVRRANAADLAQALLKLGSERQLTEEIGRKARDYALALPSWHSVAKKVTEILERSR